jgi:hypothetical protein
METDHIEEGIGESLRSVRSLGQYRLLVHSLTQDKANCCCGRHFAKQDGLDVRRGPSGYGGSTL